MSRDPATHAAGFTLIELLMVIFLVALLAGVAAVSLGYGNEDHLAMADVQVRDAIAWAQTLARSNRMPVGVVFDPGGERFAVVDQNGAQVSDPLTRRGYEVAFPRPNQPRRVDLHAADFGSCGAAVIFDAQGIPLTGGTVILQAGGRTRTLTVDGATGFVATS
jgi:prepilin-type N-terminal cleavage/methylation domain-containing protein